jgi:hypothetical protein
MASICTVPVMTHRSRIEQLIWKAIVFLENCGVYLNSSMTYNRNLRVTVQSQSVSRLRGSQLLRIAAMELILSIFGTIAVTLLAVHLYDYLADWSRAAFPRRANVAPMQAPSGIAATAFTETAESYDKAA